MKPDTGTVHVFGHPFTPADRDRVGYLPEERGLYPRQEVRATLAYLGTLKGMSPADARAESDRWLARFDLADGAAKRVDQLSKGNQQKVQVAATLIARPPIVVLDEPHSGLDPVSARMVNAVIREYAAEGRTVVLSTHQMGLVETLCSRVFMIAHGKRVLYGTLKDIKREHSSNSVRVLARADYAACPYVARVEAAHGDGAPVHVFLREPATAAELLGWLVARNADVQLFEQLSMPLEEIFVRVAGGSVAAA
jgi:ABC-2 type transport system ATP-binding protein